MTTHNNFARIFLTVAATLLLCTLNADATLIFVDNTLASDCSSTYDYTTRSCGTGAYRAYRTIAGAANIAVSGDTVVLRAGTYNEQLAPKNSGTASVPIIYSNSGSEKVIITGATLVPAIWIYKLHHIIVQGLIVSDVQRWLAVLGSDHIIIRSNAFLNANDAGGSSKTGLFFQSSNYNTVRNNIIDNSTQDNLAFVQSHHNLVEGNRITRAAHTLWTIKCGSYNVLRGNYFHNELQKIGEIYDCDGVGYGDVGYPKITQLNDTKYNVVENNVFDYTATPVNASPYAGIQHAGQYCIIRHNIFYHCLGPPIDLTLYADEARYTYGNKIYNNVFFDNQFGGVSVSGVQGSDYTFADNSLRNNVFFRNRFTRYDTRWDWYGTLDGKPVQIITGRTSGVRFEHNDIFNTTADELWNVVYGDRTSITNPPPQTLSWWQTNYPQLFADNIQADPMFTDTATKDFHPKAGSPLTDAGMFLARTVGSGNSTSMKLDAAGYFRDGFGIEGLGGDTIQLEGGTQTAVIVQADYTSSTITLDRPLVWSAGQGVSLKYNGSAPDIGAYESSSTVGIPSEPAHTSFRLYPNPAHGRLNIILPEGATRLMIANSIGEIIADCPVETQQQLSFDLSRYPAGMYTIRITVNGTTQTKRWVKTGD